MLGILIATQPGNRVWLSDVRTPANRGFVGVNSSNTSIHFEHACYISSTCFKNLNLIEIYIYIYIYLIFLLDEHNLHFMECAELKRNLLTTRSEN